jgi:ketosteroid isomerase-like protein
MSEADDFLAVIRDRQVLAERALHNGNPEPRKAMWSHRDPVTVLGAWKNATGWEQVSALFDALGEAFSDCTSFEFDIVAADARGDMAYTVGHEHTAVAVNGEPRTYTLRVTHAYRREDGDWKIVHRHGDNINAEDGDSGP